LSTYAAEVPTIGTQEMRVASSPLGANATSVP
jgi:hypothetical protein